MDWQNPEVLYLILPMCAAWIAIALYSQSRRRRASLLFVEQQMSARILPTHSNVRFWTKLVFKEIAIVAGLIALAGPRFGEQVEQVIPRGSDIYVLIDVSRSMLADDVSPNRLGRAKADIASLVNRLEGERIGLVAFAGQAVVKCPLTVDYSSFRRALNELDTNSAPRGGTAIGDAIRKSLEVFQPNADRDQAIILITDGDDQQSYPMEAATVAAERKVTIFAIGLGDSERGARIPQKANSGAFVEFEGEQVWSKLDGTLLQDIALKTSGVYVPAGTRSYDLAELYATHLQGRRGNDSLNQTRVRRAERFQIFLAIALGALMLDLMLGRFKTSVAASVLSHTTALPSRTAVAGIAMLVASLLFESALGDDSAAKVRDGLKLYAEQKFDEAHEAFAAASTKLDEQKSPKAAVAIFDEACAFHRKGDFDKARERYLQAGLSQDRDLATAAHFNLGTMSSEKARTIAGDKPELVEKEKRQEILDTLKQSISSYRHCLELNPSHLQSRRNIELTRQWIKHYGDKWSELDRQKRRNETNLIQFLEFIMQTQTALRESVVKLPSKVSADLCAELKRAQTELAQELPVLKEKIDAELRPQQTQGQASPAAVDKELEQGIALLKGWVDQANERMESAASRMLPKSIDTVESEQQSALEELDRIWNAIANFHALLGKDIELQTSITKKIGPAQVKPSEAEDPIAVDQPPPETDSDQSPTSEPLSLGNADWNQLAKSQASALTKARMLGPKAAAELEQMQSNEQKTDDANADDPKAIAPQGIEEDAKAPAANQVDPEAVKAGYRKAIELTPSAVAAMESALAEMRHKNREGTATNAAEALRILKEIQEAQPKQPPQDKQDQQDKNDQQQQNKDKNQDQQNDDNKQDDKDKKDDAEKEKDKEDSKDEDKKDKDQASKDKEKQDDKSDNQQQQPPKQISKDRIEEALRKVREREQEKHERDRQLRAKVLGRAPVDKDW